MLSTQCRGLSLPSELRNALNFQDKYVELNYLLRDTERVRKNCKPYPSINTNKDVVQLKDSESKCRSRMASSKPHSITWTYKIGVATLLIKCGCSVVLVLGY